MNNQTPALDVMFERNRAYLSHKQNLRATKVTAVASLYSNSVLQGENHRKRSEDHLLSTNEQVVNQNLDKRVNDYESWKRSERMNMTVANKGFESWKRQRDIKEVSLNKIEGPTSIDLKRKTRDDEPSPGKVT